MFNYNWELKNGYPAKGIKKNNLKVMSTFACGGGSTMGYKLAGFDVISANDIDKKMAEVYIKNHKPKQFFQMPIKDLLLRNDLPTVDILDGSPPCSTFSITGLREKAWGKEKHFREGQSKQVLDDLFFDFLDLVEKMKPKVVVAENVKGMLQGLAKGYLKLITSRFKDLGYTTQVFLLNSATMGVPQQRERVFFIANKMNKKIELNFNEPKIVFENISDLSDTISNITKKEEYYYERAKPNGPVGKFNSIRKIHNQRVVNTLTASSRHFHSTIPRRLNDKEIKLIGSWPQDYDFCGIDPNYIIGMSVPPVMMAQIANQIHKQLY